MKVRSVQYAELTKRYRLQNGKRFETHRYCCLGPRDDVIIRSASLVEARCQNGYAKVLPLYSAKDTLRVGTKLISLRVKEIESGEEFAGYHRLEECHYRGKVLHGRRVPLIIGCDNPLFPSILGYIELTTAFMMSKPRSKLFDAEFQCEKTGISWTRWDKSAVQQYTNLVVRIARVVVSPEFRGLGLARLLVKHAARFARDHWHVGRLKPFFIEITADMLRYVPFVESAGMQYIGETEGNLGRVNTDMTYILSNLDRVKRREILREESAGIVDLQVQYATLLDRLVKEQGLTIEGTLQLLLKSPHRLSDENWSLLHRVLRLPKPTFLMGLTPAANRFVAERAKELALPGRFPAIRPEARGSVRQAPIRVKNCGLTLSSTLVRTRATRKVQQAFGVDRDMLTTTPFSDLNFEIAGGDIVLICGPSGVGKSSLLSLLSGALLNPGDRREGARGTIRVPKGLKVSALAPLSSTRPLINSLGRVSFEEALFSLNVSGLAEAHLYVKRFRELSNGQRYRAMVAKLIASEAQVWIADEFCATLDPVTANIVARNLRRCAKELGVTVIVAAANWSEFVHELRPDKVVHLRAPWDSRVFSWAEFDRAIATPDVPVRPIRHRTSAS